MVINGSYWSGKEEGQTGAKTFLKKENGMGTFKTVVEVDIQWYFCFSELI